MSQTMNTLILDVIPRLINAPKGVSIYQAANSILSLVYKKLLQRNSDLLASGQLELNIPAYGHTAQLPGDFVSLAEKPRTEEYYTDWMSGTVVSYDPVVGTLVFNVIEFNGTDNIDSWAITLAGVPGNPATTIGYSNTAIIPRGGTITMVMSAGVVLPVGVEIYIVPVENRPRITYLQPTYLGEDDEHDEKWWGWYGYYGQIYEPPCIRPHKYKIVGTTMYIRPKPIIPIIVKGKYFSKPVDFVTYTDVIPWGLFYEVFRDGVVRIIMKGISIPESDPDFAAFIYREVDTIINSRFKLVPYRRTSRRNFM